MENLPRPAADVLSSPANTICFSTLFLRGVSIAVEKEEVTRIRLSDSDRERPPLLPPPSLRGVALGELNRGVPNSMFWKDFSSSESTRTRADSEVLRYVYSNISQRSKNSM
jgi:hypothetical protein